MKSTPAEAATMMNLFALDTEISVPTLFTMLTYALDKAGHDARRASPSRSRRNTDDC